MTLDYPAIDVHAHYGPYSPGGDSHARWCMSGTAAEVAERGRAARTQWTIVSPTTGLFPRGHVNPVAGNEEAALTVPATPGLLQYVIVSPLHPETYDQARRMFASRTCVGIKLHPEEHRYPIREHGRKLFELAAELRAVVLVHSGEQLSMPEDYIPFADDFPEVRLILAHIGCGWDGRRDLQARAVQMSKRGNVYTDTSSMMSILPRNIEWTVKECGADRVLYGTDTPLYFAPMQRARIDYAEISDTQKRMILRDNAVRVFGGKLSAL